MDTTEHLEWLATEGDRFAQAIGHGPLEAPVVACPDWSLGDLGVHVGTVHRWAAAAARSGAPPGPEVGAGAPRPDDGAQALADWYRAGLDGLLDLLRANADSTPTWHPFPAPRELGVWKRRQAHEITIHRWDAQRAAGVDVAPIDAALASDGIDEFLGMIVPRVVIREKVSTPAASLHVHCTDVQGEWLVWSDASGYQFRRQHAKGDAALRGPAADLLLLLHRRAPVSDDTDIIGDEAAVTAWTSLPGF